MKEEIEKLFELKKTEGFPLGEWEDILSLSDIPSYTAFPNPFIDEFIKEWEWEKHLFHHRDGMKDIKGDIINKDNFDASKCRLCIEKDKNYHREPYITDVREGKAHLLYTLHSYHTKVPHKAIMRYILHYTDPGDIIFDGFCGTGMTGLASQMCGSEDALEELGYKVEDGIVLAPHEDKGWTPVSKPGERKTILNDLSPLATFIAYNYNTSLDKEDFEDLSTKILLELEKECSWMYETNHLVDGLAQTDKEGRFIKGRINYTIWSDVFICPECHGEIVLWDLSVDKSSGSIKKTFSCNLCSALLFRNRLKKLQKEKYDIYINETVRQVKQIPVLINYTFRGRRFDKIPDETDLDLIKEIENLSIPYWFPTLPLPEGYNTEQPKKSHGLSHVHHFYTHRNLYVLSSFYNKALNYINSRTGKALIFILTAVRMFSSRQAKLQPEKFFKKRGQSISYVTGTLYIPSFSVENCPLLSIKNRMALLKKTHHTLSHKSIVISTESLKTMFKESSVDYIFTDPPFGGNKMYSELNYLWEAFLKVKTDNRKEVVLNIKQKKDIFSYQALMEDCFKSYYRLLKPGRFITIEFHNSSNKVWRAIQEAIRKSGFIISHVAMLDKKQGSFKQVTTFKAPKQDLVITAYRPLESSLNSSELKDVTDEEIVWDFIREYLEDLPSVPPSGEVVSERTPGFLFDRLVAYLVQRGYTVPLSAGEFQQKLSEKFLLRHGMTFVSS
ncbi:MAG TPA: DNA methyltransferase [Candidatus Eremiobacteraeota bacterium]|nr:DNA methyltransferase [Candidatus Eremiobacteraeota bacterium]